MSDNLLLALQGSLNGDNVIRQQAEAFLINSFTTPLICTQLLAIICGPTIDTNVKLQAAIMAKNIMRKYWKPKKDQYTISLTEKSTIRESLFEIICKIDNKPTLKLFEEMITIVGKVDYPDNWSSLLPNVKKGLVSGIFQITRASLKVLVRLVEFYKLELSTARNPLEDIISETFGILLSIIKKCSLDNEEHCLIAFSILKAFFQ